MSRTEEAGAARHPIFAHLTADGGMRSLAVVGQSGSGKSSAVKGGVEPLLRAGYRTCIIDPTGVWWGLRLAADGKAPSGLQVAIFGGEHADVEIGVSGGQRLGELIADGSIPQSIIDVSTFSGPEQTRFLTDFSEAIFTLNRGAMYLVLDEADVMVPQTAMPEGRRLKGAVDKIMRRGRVKGFRPVLITQRPAVIDKSALAQVNGLVAMALSLPHDRSAIDDWIAGRVKPEMAKEISNDLPTLPVGHGFLISAIMLNHASRCHFPLPETFDSMRAPDLDEELPEPVALSSIDISAIGKALGEPAEKTIRNKGGRGSGQHPIRHTAPPVAADLEAAEKAAYERGRIAGDAEGYARGVKAGETKGAERVRAAMPYLNNFIVAVAGGDAAAMLPEATGTPRPGGFIRPDTTAATKEVKRRVAATPSLSKAGAVTSIDNLTNPQLELLGALAWWRAHGHHAPTRTQLAAIAGWKPKGSNLRNRLSELSRANLVSYPSEGLVTLTDAGAARAPKPNVGTTLMESLRAALTSPQIAIFDALVAAGGLMSRTALAVAVDWDPGGSNLRNRLSELSQLELVEYPARGTVDLQRWVRDGIRMKRSA